jgi:hypothetical protein
MVERECSACVSRSELVRMGGKILGGRRAMRGVFGREGRRWEVRCFHWRFLLNGEMGCWMLN